ncbi:hypothetical protein, partial [Streptomyces sp. CA-251251]|uniref:hypothetical protein n=1 Tax=Streptomyces sp. CA-251251 TaxID=3240063 RepID=UPI003D8F4FFC
AGRPGSGGGRCVDQWLKSMSPCAPSLVDQEALWPGRRAWRGAVPGFLPYVRSLAAGVLEEEVMNSERTPGSCAWPACGFVEAQAHSWPPQP